jgi:hypothetical protein
MKKILLMISAMFFTTNDAQQYRIGINTAEPKATLDISRIELNELPMGYAQGFMLPSFTTAERDTFTGVKRGMMIYSITNNCIESYTLIGSQDEWKCLVDIEDSNRDGFIVNPSGYRSWGTGLVAGTAISPWSVSVMFTVVNNTDSPITGQDFSNSVTIINPSGGTVAVDMANVFQLQNVNIPAGGQMTLRYILTGTPVSGPLLIQFQQLGATVDQIIKIN